MSNRNEYKSDWWCAWIAPNGRSYFDAPRRLYYPDEEQMGGGLMWDKGGNDCVAHADLGGLSDIGDSGGFTFTSKNKMEVVLVIEACGLVLASIAASWGLREA